VTSRSDDTASFGQYLSRTISYKLLRIINSSWYQLSRELESIPHTGVLLGTATLKNWLTWLSLIRTAITQRSGGLGALLQTGESCERDEWQDIDTKRLAPRGAAVGLAADAAPAGVRSTILTLAFSSPKRRFVSLLRNAQLHGFCVFMV
jgi:hypothetical protein